MVTRKISLILVAAVLLSTVVFSPSAAARTVEHALGVVEVPDDVKRPVALFDFFLDHLVALDITPVAGDSRGANRFVTYLDAVLKERGTVPIGDQWNPSLEAILMAQPDLILTHANVHDKVYDQLNAIAPTAAYLGTEVGADGQVHRRSWDDLFRDTAQTVGKTEEAERIIADLQSRIHDLRERVREKYSDETFLYLRVLPKEIRVYGHDLWGGPGWLLHDALELRPAPVPMDKPTGAISVEAFPGINPDHIFMALQSEEKLEEFKNTPLWKNLTAVKKDQIYPVDPETFQTETGPISLGLQLDTIEKALLN